MGNGDSDWEVRVVEPQIGRCHSNPPFCSPHLILPLVILPCLSPSDRRQRKHQQQHSKNTQGKSPSLEVSCTTATNKKSLETVSSLLLKEKTHTREPQLRHQMVATSPLEKVRMVKNG
jgi:hypothetical protein